MPPRGHIRPRHRRLKVRSVLVLAALVLAVGMARLAGPATTIRDQSERLVQLEAQKAALLAYRATLAEEKAELATQPGQEAAARRQGYVRPGERRLVFVRNKKAPTESVGGVVDLPPEP